MSGPIKINYQQYKSSLEQQQLLAALTHAEQEMQYYRKKHRQAKVINKAITEAIRRVYSDNVASQLQRIIEIEEEAKKNEVNYEILTHTFCGVMANLAHQPQNQHSLQSTKYGTPKKGRCSLNSASLIKPEKHDLSPFKFSQSKRTTEQLQSRLTSRQVSTQKSSISSQKNIATEIYCELCERIYPPNEFVTHAERCKYELEYLPDQSDGQAVNHDKLMRNLLKIRQEIEEQIRLIAHSQQQIDRANLKNKLEKDLKKVMKVINEKEQEIKLKAKKSTTKTILKTKPQLR